MDSQDPQQPPPQPPQDYATRFRAEGEPAAAPTGAPARQDAQTAPPSFAGLLETAVVVPFRPWHAFEGAAARPAPSFAALAGVCVVSAVSFFALNMLHAAIAYPWALNYPADRFAVVAVVALLLAVLWSFVLAGALHVAALVCGGRGSFARSYQAVALMGALLPATAALLWVSPAAALLPALAAAVAAAAALETLHAAKPMAARACCAVIAAAALGGGWLVVSFAQSYAAQLRALSAASSLASALPAAAPGAAPGALASPAAPVDPATAAAAAMQAAAAAVSAAGAPAAGAQAPSSLDMISGPSGAGAAPAAGAAASGWGAPNAAGAPPTALTPQQVQQISQSGANIMGALAPLMQAQMANAKDPRQRAQFQQLAAMMGQLQGSIQSGKPMTPDEKRRFAAQMQQLSGQMQKMYGAQLQKDAGLAPAPPAAGGQK